MLCQKCHEKMASVFISSIVNGTETKTYLCDDCAKDYQLFNFNMEEPFSIKDIMEKLKVEEELVNNKKLLKVDIENKNKEVICTNCYSTYDEYRETGKLGCSKCYEVFEKQLKPIMKNIYGYAEYIGKIPNINGTHIYINHEIKILKADLNMAVEKEEYEKAASIRDKIRELEECSE
ncbi:MAG: UvrB/UvrC motif-containing protein [Peptostreptococcaceae bacterium]